MSALVLKKGREKSLRRRHPWIYSGAVERVAGKPAPGETLEVKSAPGAVLAQAAWSPTSQIRARVWSFDPGEAIDAAFFRRRVRAAVALRAGLAAAKHT
ncbi:MAG TPA: 23S rRNA (cytosine(1962)-C(5))-methyltransferase RlmI, partial [Burkholderiales bacterium]|nr:23S rRNA (cytosine(1962)-C(5))-methyltransferase RlmI [Burkholderiales bacterium]